MTLVLDAVPLLPQQTNDWDVADQVVADLRAVVGNIADAQEWCARGAGDWSGDTPDAADHAQTTMARDLDVAQAAVESAAAAADVFAEEIGRLKRELETELTPVRATLVEQSETLAGRTATTDAEVAALETDVRTFNGQVATFQSDVDAWRTAVEEAEDAFVRALQAGDTTTEAEGLADSPGRIDPDPLATHLGGLADDPRAARDYWESLTPAQQQALLTQHPDVVGNTDGLPAAVRDDANRASLARDLDYWAKREEDGQLSDPEKEHYAHAQAVQEQVEAYDEEYDPVTGDHLLHLIGYDPDAHSDDGSVIISLGDPDHATHVSTYVPGTTTTASTIGGSVDKSYDVWEGAQEAGAGSVATIVWLDYDAPSIGGLSMDELEDIASVASSDAAADAGGDLSGYLDGLRASRGTDADGEQLPDAHLTLIGHSYGATTSAWAAHDGADVDDLVLLGSPGAPTSTAAELTDANVYVGAAAYDPVSLLGEGVRGGDIPAHHHDPAQESFGAQRIEVADGSYRAQDFLSNHSSYFEGTSLDNVTAIVAGNEPTSVVEGRDGSNYQTLPELVAGAGSRSLGEWLWDELTR